MADSTRASAGLLEGKFALITGVGRGIGKACAHVFIREGAQVFGVDYSGEEKVVAEELGAAFTPHHADLTKEDEIVAMFEAAVRRYGRLDAVLNVAATQDGRKSEETAEEYERMTALNLRGTLLCTRYAVNAMIPTGGGAIVNFSSVGGLNDEAMAPIMYSASKAGVNSLTKAFAVQFGDRGIRANILSPGFTLTEGTRGAGPDILSKMSARSALGRPCEAREQAEVAAFLASDRASYITGANIVVDGGWSAKLA